MEPDTTSVCPQPAPTALTSLTPQTSLLPHESCGQEWSLSFLPRRAHTVSSKPNLLPIALPAPLVGAHYRVPGFTTWPYRPDLAGMSGRSGYGYGNGYSDSGRYDQGDGAYGGSNNLGVNGYSGRSAGNTGGGPRPGGYGGFYPEQTQQPSLSPAPSPERRRDRSDRDRPQQSTSRSRSRNETADRRYQGSRDDRTRDGLRPPDSRGRDLDPSDSGAAEASTREMQSVEGSSILLW